jgi:hypothetical protein
LGVKLREVFGVKLYKKRETASGEVSTQGFFREVLASKLREVLRRKLASLNSPIVPSAVIGCGKDVERTQRHCEVQVRVLWTM